MRYFQVLIISFAIHVFLAVILSGIEVPPSNVSKKITYIDLVEKPELPRRPQQPPQEEKAFVRSAPAPDELLTKEKKEARFSSEEDQYVLQEQKARASGMTANRLNADRGEKRKEKETPALKTTKRDEIDLKPRSALDKAKEEISRDEFEREIANRNELGDVKTGAQERSEERTEDSPPVSRDLDLRRFANMGSGMSTVGENLPDDIRFGDFTALNTDRNLYYTFYARMEEQIRHRWITYARAALYNLPPADRRFSDSDTWTTELEVFLDREGNFVRAVLRDTSGIHSLDSAPVQAFKDASKFPNPPPEMVKEDGTIRILYSFSVNINSRFAGNGG